MSQSECQNLCNGHAPRAENYIDMLVTNSGWIFGYGKNGDEWHPALSHCLKLAECERKEPIIVATDCMECAHVVLMWLTTRNTIYGVTDEPVRIDLTRNDGEFHCRAAQGFDDDLVAWEADGQSAYDAFSAAVSQISEHTLELMHPISHSLKLLKEAGLDKSLPLPEQIIEAQKPFRDMKFRDIYNALEGE